MNEPVFGHGQLRLYLLHTLCDGPASGYDIMRRLHDRFGGLYSPSAGTVYPRLAKLEEEGLVRRLDQGRRSAFELTDDGRAEVERRSDDVAAVARRLDEAHRRLADEMRTRVETGAAHLRDELEAAARIARDAAAPTDRGAAADPDGSRPRRGTDWSDLARWFAYAAGDSLGHARRGRPTTDGATGPADPRRAAPEDRTTRTTTSTAADDPDVSGPPEATEPTDFATRRPVTPEETAGASAGGNGGRERASFTGAGIPSAEAWTDILAILRDAAARIQDRLEDDPPRRDEG